MDSQLNKKAIKIDEDEESTPENLISILENNLLQTSGKIWDSSQILGRYLIEQAYYKKLKLAGEAILELGCGTGVLGILLACYGANVLLTDLGQVDTLVDFNLKSNEKVVKRHCGSVKFRVLDWGQDENKTVNYSVDGFPFKIIVAADPIYDEKTFQSFFSILQQLYSRQKPICYLAYKKRDAVIDKQIIIKIEDIGCWYRLIDFEELNHQWRSRQIDVYQIGKF